MLSNSQDVLKNKLDVFFIIWAITNKYLIEMIYQASKNRFEKSSSSKIITAIRI